VFGEPGRERPGAAPDVEHAPAAEIACVGKEPENLGAKLGIRVTKLVVARRERGEVRARARR
jgi:hypothetical protein